MFLNQLVLGIQWNPIKYLYNFSGPDGRVQVEEHGGGWKEGKEGRQQKIIWINFTYYTETFFLDQMVEGLIWKEPRGTLCNRIHFTLNTEKTLTNVLETADIKCSRDSKTCNEITYSITNFTGLFLWKISLENFSGPDGGVQVEKKQGGGWKKRETSINVSATSVSLRHSSTNWIRMSEMVQSSPAHCAAAPRSAFHRRRRHYRHRHYRRRYPRRHRRCRRCNRRAAAVMPWRR